MHNKDKCVCYSEVCEQETTTEIEKEANYQHAMRCGVGAEGGKCKRTNAQSREGKRLRSKTMYYWPRRAATQVSSNKHTKTLKLHKIYT